MSLQTKRYANGSFDGLTDLRYNLHDVQLRPLYTWIHADLNGSITLLIARERRGIYTRCLDNTRKLLSFTVIC